MKHSKELQDVQSKKINKQMGRAHDVGPKQKAKEFRTSKDGDYSESDERPTGMICKLLSQKCAVGVDIDMFDDNTMEFNYLMSIFQDKLE